MQTAPCAAVCSVWDNFHQVTASQRRIAVSILVCVSRGKTHAGGIRRITLTPVMRPGMSRRLIFIAAIGAEEHRNHHHDACRKHRV